MRLSNTKRHLLKSSVAVLAGSLSISAAIAQIQGQPTYRQNANMIDPNSRWVALPTGVADMTAQHFKLPKDTFTYGIAGMTMFPYYEASPQLQDFLNSRVGGLPITELTATPNLPSTFLPPTDTTRLNYIPLTNRRVEPAQSASRIALRGSFNDEMSWRVAHQGGQSFAVPGDNQSVVMVSAGTMFNAAAVRTMALRCGTMWIITGAKPVAVLTKYGAVAVSPHSIAAVEQTWFNKVKTAVLFGSSSEVQLSHKGNTSRVAVEKGKELTISQSATASAGTSDYVDTNKSSDLIASRLPSATGTLPDLNLSTRTIDADSSTYVSDLKAINPPLTDLRMVNAYKNMFKEYGITNQMRLAAIRNQFLQKDAVAAAAKPPAYKASLDDRYFVPVYKKVRGATPVAFPHVDDTLKSLWTQHGAVKYLSSTNIEVERGGRVAMGPGEAMFAANEPMSVRVNDCFIDIQSGALVQVIAKKDIVVVRNIKENGNNDVKLKVRSRTIDCAAGGELIVANTMPTIYAEMKSDGVTRRDVHSIETSNGSVIINKSEIELTSLLKYNPIMRLLCESKDQYDQKLVAQIVKMDAVLTMVTKGRGSYQRMAGMPTSH